MTLMTSFSTACSNDIIFENDVIRPDLTLKGKERPVPVGTGNFFEYQFHFAIAREHFSMNNSNKNISNDVGITQNDQKHNININKIVKNM